MKISEKYLPPPIRRINKRISFIEDTKIYKTVLGPSNINLHDYKEVKFGKIQVFLKDPKENIRNLKELEDILKLYERYFEEDGSSKTLKDIGWIDNAEKRHKDGELYLTAKHEKFRNEKEIEMKNIINENEKQKIKNEIEKNRKEAIFKIFKQRFKEIKICKNKIAPSPNKKYNNGNLRNFLKSEYDKQKNIFETNLNNNINQNINNKLNSILKDVIFSHKNTRDNCNPTNSDINKDNFSYLMTQYIRKQYNENNENNENNKTTEINGRIFLLGAISLINKYKFCEKYFINVFSVVLLKYIKTTNNIGDEDKCINSKFIFWSMMLNMMFLLYIANNKNIDISGIILLQPENMYKNLDESKYSDVNHKSNENCFMISRKRADTDQNSIKKYRFIGYIIIPYIKNTGNNHTSKKLNELYVFIFEDNYGIYLFDYDNGSIEKDGYVYRNQTVLISEIKTLAKYLNVGFYYDKNLPGYIFLSTKPENELKIKYNNLIKLQFTDKHYDISLSSVRENQILLYYDEYINNIKTRINILQSIEKSDIEYIVPDNNLTSRKIPIINRPIINRPIINRPIVIPEIMIGGSNKILLYEKLEKIMKYRSEIQKIYFSNNRLEYQKFINDNYLISKYQYPFIKKYRVTNSNFFSISKNNKNIKIDFNKLLDNENKVYVYKYYPYTIGYYRSYEIIYNDILNFKNKTIAEISTLPSFFEVFKELFNKKIDLYLTDKNYFCMDKIEWQKLISIYKNKISHNILYNSNINKKYDILFVSLLINITNKYIPKNVSIESSEYVLKYIDKEVYNTNIEEIKYLKYLNKGGTFYMLLYAITNKKLFDLYISLGKEFENIEFYIDKYADNHYIFGGIWLKCYNYKSQKRLSNSDLIKKYELFYNKYYNNKYKWLENFEKFVIEYQNSSHENINNLKKKVLNKQLLYLKNMSNDFNIKLNPEWEKFIYINFFLVNAFKSINYRYNSSNDYQNLFRTFSTEYAYEKYQIVKNQNNIYLNYSIIKKHIFSIIEFLLLVREKYNLKDVLVIFTNNQKYISVILKLFPNLNYTILNKKKVTIIKKNKNIKYKILISDIENLTIQKNLVKKLNVVGYMLNVNKFSNVKNKVIKYFNGELYFNNNINLINIKNNKFKIIEYDILDYKSQLNYFRNIDEYSKYKYKDSDIMKYNILGYDDSYYCVTEYYIIDKYYDEKEDYKKIIETIYTINKELLFKSNSDIIIDLNSILKNKSKNINDLLIKVLFSLKNQNNYIDKGNILPQIEYLNMKNKINEIYEKINNYIINNKFSKNIKLMKLIKITNKLYNILSNYDYISYDINFYDNQYQEIYKQYTKLLN